MIHLTAAIEQLGNAGDKTRWSFVRIPAAVAATLAPGLRREFRVKGRLDAHPVKAVCLLPMGDGDFMLPMNAAIRRGTGKTAGAILELWLEKDDAPLPLHPELLEALRHSPAADAHFAGLKPSAQRYFSKWVEDAKTEGTKTARIIRCVTALERGLDYGAMLREARDERRETGGAAGFGKL